MNKPIASVVLLSGVLLYPHLAIAGGLTPQHLRCEYQKDPIGVSHVPPQLSWIVTAAPPERGKGQSAYRVLVASSRAELDVNRGDQWDSGQVASSETLHIIYGGKQLRSNQQYFWKVHVWDEAGKVSPWSESAVWVTGLLNRSDWKAKWITDSDVLVSPEAQTAALRGVNSGYQSATAGNPNVEKWVGVDLGEPVLIDTVRLFPATRFTFQEKSGTVSFPERYRIELANRSDFSGAWVVADLTKIDSQAPQVGDEPATFRFPPTKARYARVYVTRLSPENEAFARFELAEMEVLSNGKNVALNKPVLALDSFEGPGWSKKFLTDGVVDVVRRKEIRQPVAWMRRSFRVEAPIRRATVFATARGIYELHVNGKRIGDRILAPEWTSYRRRSQYQGYDVTSALRPGDNVIGAVLSHGWYAGFVPFGGRHVYGSTPELLVQLEMEYTDGRHLVLGTDASWRRAENGPIVSSDIYDGETYDARKEMPGWDAPGFDDSAWKPSVVAFGNDQAQLSWQSDEPIRAHREVKAVALSEPLPGIYVFDLGQNMVGHVRLKVNGPTGTTVKMRHAEVLRDDGEIYTDSLRDAWQIDRYIKRTGREETYEPHFTYHGFRYVELTGLPQRPAIDAVTGIVFYSSAPDVGEFETSSDFVNKLHSNIIWTQHANMEGIPTDCPQRDERLGWTGDIQVFAQSAMFNMEMASFLRKYLQDVRDDQDPDGDFPNMAPDPTKPLRDRVPAFRNMQGGPGWADAGTVLPWELWVNYGDKQMLAEQYSAAKAWVEYVERHSSDLLWNDPRTVGGGDWLNGDTLIWPGWPRQGAAMPSDVYATAFFAHSADLVSRMAAVLGQDEDARHFRKLFEQIKAAFNRAYIVPEGRMKGDTQSGYALALRFNLLPDNLRAAAVQRMLAAISRYGGHLSTGIQSTHRLMLELSRAGRSDEAYRVLMIHGFPSWSLMIENGATTMWERWDGYVKERGFQTPEMNSFNHYALGSVDEWMWRNIVGINPDDQGAGYKHFIIRPEVGGGLTWARGSYHSIRGPIRTSWKVEGKRLLVSLTVPANTTATVYLPMQEGSRVTEGGRPVSQAPGVQLSSNGSEFEVSSGDYEFIVEPFVSVGLVAE